MREGVCGTQDLIQPSCFKGHNAEGVFYRKGSNSQFAGPGDFITSDGKKTRGFWP